MKAVSEYIKKADHLEDKFILRLGATIAQAHENYDSVVGQCDARFYGDFNFNNKARKLARTYRRDIVIAIKNKGSKWLHRYENFRPEPFELHFDGKDFWIWDSPADPFDTPRAA